MLYTRALYIIELCDFNINYIIVRMLCLCVHTDMSDEDSQLEDVDALMKNVQSSIEELSKLQQQAATVS